MKWAVRSLGALLLLVELNFIYKILGHQWLSGAFLLGIIFFIAGYFSKNESFKEGCWSFLIGPTFIFIFAGIVYLSSTYTLTNYVLYIASGGFIVFTLLLYFFSFISDLYANLFSKED